MTYVTKQIRLVSNKFNCRRSDPEDELEVRLSVKGMKQKQPTVAAVEADALDLMLGLGLGFRV